MMKCLACAFLKKREFSKDRVVGFIKQICTTSLHAPSYTSIPLLAMGRQLLSHYPTIQPQIIENDLEDIVANVNTEPPLAWELGTLKFHINPQIRKHAMGAAQAKMLQLPIEDPFRIRANVMENDQMAYIPLKVRHKKHPLSSSTSNNNNNKRRKREQIRFITPRKTKSHHMTHGSMSFL